MNEALLRSNERKRLRALNYKFDCHVESFLEEYEITGEEKEYLFKEYFLKELIQNIDRKLLALYEKNR